MDPYPIWTGRTTPAPPILQLKAGELEVDFVDGDLRYLRWGGHELVRRIYMAVRDINWNTIPALYSNLEIESGADHFRIEFDAEHRTEQLGFRWHGRISGSSAGEINLDLSGNALTDFRYCRIGWCVLYPIRGIAGQPYRSSDGEQSHTGLLPRSIAPQKIENGFETPMFPPFNFLEIDHPAGITISTRFSGDLFEMEDQRNWTDGSYKVYSTPISLGYPHSMERGSSIQQSVSLKMQLPAGRSDQSIEAEVMRIRLDGEAGPPLPQIGMEIPAGAPLPDARETALLKALAPAHLKAQVQLGSAQWKADWARQAQYAARIGVPLEVVLFLGGDEEKNLRDFAQTAQNTPISRLIIFHESDHAKVVTAPRWLNLARAILSPRFPDAPIVGGSNGNFAEVNRQQVIWQTMDGLAYPLNPQVHASDDLSLIEGIEAQADTLSTVRAQTDLPVFLSSITLKPPFNQAAQEEEHFSAAELPPNVDPRQVSLFAAGWTIGSLASITRGGAASATYYETTGWRGLFESAAGSPMPERFPSQACQVFPIYHVLRFINGLRAAQQLTAVNSHPLRVAQLALSSSTGLRLLVANLTPDEQNVAIENLPEGRLQLTRLNHANATLWQNGEMPPAEALAQGLPAGACHLAPYEIILIQIRQ